MSGEAGSFWQVKLTLPVFTLLGLFSLTVPRSLRIPSERPPTIWLEHCEFILQLLPRCTETSTPTYESQR